MMLDSAISVHSTACPLGCGLTYFSIYDSCEVNEGRARVLSIISWDLGNDVITEVINQGIDYRIDLGRGYR